MQPLRTTTRWWNACLHCINAGAAPASVSLQHGCHVDAVLAFLSRGSWITGSAASATATTIRFCLRIKPSGVSPHAAAHTLLLFTSSVITSGKAGGFLALDWNDGSPVGPLARHSYALHAQLADVLGAEAIGYRQLDTIQVCSRTVWLYQSASCNQSMLHLVARVKLFTV